jgi:hypothetical protein
MLPIYVIIFVDQKNHNHLEYSHHLKMEKNHLKMEMKEEMKEEMKPHEEPKSTNLSSLVLYQRVSSLTLMKEFSWLSIFVN